jgi:hypothetical protein
MPLLVQFQGGLYLLLIENQKYPDCHLSSIPQQLHYKHETGYSKDNK